MRLVSRSDRQGPEPITYWCVACNHFRLVVDGSVPEHHGQPMVASADDPSRVEPDAPIDDPDRRPRARGSGSPAAPPAQPTMDQLKARVRAMGDAAVERTPELEHVRSTVAIPVIHDREDEDLALFAIQGLVARGQPAVQSIPEPRHVHQGRLDPNWWEKYRPVLEGCEVVVYARRVGRQPNPGTQTELQLLAELGKPVVLFERP